MCVSGDRTIKKVKKSVREGVWAKQRETSLLRAGMVGGASLLKTKSYALCTNGSSPKKSANGTARGNAKEKNV